MANEKHGGITRTDLSDIRAEIEQLRDDLDSMLGAAGNLAQDEAAAVAGSARDGLRRGAERLREVLGQTRERVRAARDGVQHQVEDHPFASLAIAFVAGAILGGVLRRRGD